MDFTFANVFDYSPPKAYDVLEELRYKKESEESSEVWSMIYLIKI